MEVSERYSSAATATGRRGRKRGTARLTLGLLSAALVAMSGVTSLQSLSFGALADSTATASSSSQSQSLSWITGSRLTLSQLDALGLREGTQCPEVSYTRVVSLHDGPGPQAVTMSHIATPREEAVLLFGVPMGHRETYGRLSKRSDKLVIDAFAAESFVAVTRTYAHGTAPKATTPATNSTSSKVSVAADGTVTVVDYHHLSTIEITCRSPLYRVSCEARYLFARPNSRLLDPSLVLIHPLESRTTLPLNGISTIIASALTSTAAATIGTVAFEDMVSIEYLSFAIPAVNYPCQRTEHWLRTIPAYVEAAVMSGLVSAIGGDTTSREGAAFGGLVPTVVAGRHLQVSKGPQLTRRVNDNRGEWTGEFVATSSSSSSSSSTSTAATASDGTAHLNYSALVTPRYSLHHYRVVGSDEPPHLLDGLKGATYLLTAFVVLTLVAILTMVLSRRRFIAATRDAWATPDGRPMCFGNVQGTWRPTAPAAAGDGGGTRRRGRGDGDEDGDEDEEDEEYEEEEEEGEEE